MGRRSVNTTKSGKYMNPTDQARKEARKKELKKNKRQRQMVRQAVLKGKDPFQLIADMEKIDSMEYNVLQPAPLNEKVLKEKRRKLREILDRVLKLYQKEEPDKWEEVKRMESEYEKRRVTLATYSEAVRHAQQVQIDDIPLPLAGLGPSHIPLPDLLPGILRKKASGSVTTKLPPGVPPLPPVDWSSDEEIPYIEEKQRPRTIRFADSDDEDNENIKRDDLVKNDVLTVQAPTGQLPVGLPPAPPPPLGVVGAMRPPGPPPGLPPRLIPNIRLPPAPPPPRLPVRMAGPGSVLTAAPQLIRKDQGPTIEAKAQIRNLGGDVTRFVPTALRVRRNDFRALPKTVKAEPTREHIKPQTKDDAYSQFMREMEDLL